MEITQTKYSILAEDSLPIKLSIQESGLYADLAFSVLT